jgi:glycosyltransferase involved in cell wall biosynthesis
LAYRLVTRQAVKQARQILVPATAVAGTIQDFFPNTQHKITVTKEGISQSFSKVYQQLSSAQGKSTQTQSDFQPRQLIYVGSLYPHKNVKLILQLLRQQPQLRLTVVSARDVFVERFLQEVQALKLQAQVDYTGYLSDAELIKQLQSSLALIQPSLSEGFGLTGVEAMACGTPVLASDIAVFHEIYQQAPIYFDPHSTQSLHTAIKQVQQSKQRQKCIKQGYQVVAEYSWQKTAQQTWHSYQQTLYDQP